VFILEMKKKQQQKQKASFSVVLSRLNEILNIYLREKKN